MTRHSVKGFYGALVARANEEPSDRIKEVRLATLQKEIRKGRDSGDAIDGALVCERLREKSRAHKRKGA